MGNSVTKFSPAKINLFLAITDRRADGFHNLVSVAVPLSFGDSLRVTLAEEISFTCDDPMLPTDDSNLVIKAVKAFQQATGRKGGATLRLEKRIPMGAGLGGGSSNAVATLKALNELTGNLLSAEALREVAATLGADCALFVEEAPVVMRGRGEQVELLGGDTRARLRGREVLMFKPPFGVSTPWAYGQMVKMPELYLSSDSAEKRLADWRRDSEAILDSLLYNNMQSVVFSKYPALPALHAMLREKYGLNPVMSGSGSASFVLLEEGAPMEEISALIRENWGEEAFISIAALA